MLKTIMPVVAWAALAVCLVVVLLGLYLLVTGRVPSVPGWFWSPEGRAGEPLVRPRLLGLAQVLWGSGMAVLLLAAAVGLSRPEPDREPEFSAVDITVAVGLGGLLLGAQILAVVLSWRAYRPRPGRPSS